MKQRPAQQVIGAFTVGLAVDRQASVIHSLLELALRVEDKGSRGQPFGETGIRPERAFARRHPSLHPFGLGLVEIVEQAAHVSDAGVGEGEIRIQHHRAFVHLHGKLEVGARPAAGEAPAAQEIIVSLEVFRRLLGDGIFFLR